jgi:uncharacterized protein YdaU (DUF1376 family)
MHPIAKLGYIFLLASAWQTSDCAISADPIDLASASGLGDELWAQYHVRILRKFEMVKGGRLRNHVLYGEWMEAKRIFEARSAAAKRTNVIRSPNADRTVTEFRPSRSADTITGTVTETGSTPMKRDFN